jgi:hypothetical protein
MALHSVKQRRHLCWLEPTHPWSLLFDLDDRWYGDDLATLMSLVQCRLAGGDDLFDEA